MWDSWVIVGWGNWSTGPGNRPNPELPDVSHLTGTTPRGLIILSQLLPEACQVLVERGDLQRDYLELLVDAAKWALRLCLVMMKFMSWRSSMMSFAGPSALKGWSRQWR